MKIIGIGRELPKQVYLMADSAIIKTNKPFFVPHFAHRFTGTPAIALHIDRLGKHIAPRYAHRYCGSIAPAIKVSAHDIETPQQSEIFSALSQSFDGALLLGDFSAIDDPSRINETSVTVERNGENAGTGSMTLAAVDYSSLIAQLSVFFTLKMGDMIVVELCDKAFEINIGDTLKASCDGIAGLTIRVK